jgi:putative SOS response-associated peptidase YedK
MCYSVVWIKDRDGMVRKYYVDKHDLSKLTRQDDYYVYQPVWDKVDDYYFVSGFSKPFLPVVTHNGIELKRWGLIPNWVLDPISANEICGKTLNAVGETVFQKPSFKKNILSRRCVLPVNGFYEWRDVNKAKYPYFIKPREGDVFRLGCIYDTWLNKETGEELSTFSILTTPANPLMEKIHNLKKRMPLILRPEDEDQWVDPDLKPAQITALIKTFDEAEMEAYTVSKLVNSTKNERNEPGAIEGVEYPELMLLDS